MRFKTTASLMRGMGAMMGGDGDGDRRSRTQQQPASSSRKKKKRFGLGDLLGGAIPVPH